MPGTAADRPRLGRAEVASTGSSRSRRRPPSSRPRSPASPHLRLVPARHVEPATRGNKRSADRDRHYRHGRSCDQCPEEQGRSGAGARHRECPDPLRLATNQKLPDVRQCELSSQRPRRNRRVRSGGSRHHRRPGPVTSFASISTNPRGAITHGPWASASRIHSTELWEAIHARSVLEAQQATHREDREAARSSRSGTLVGVEMNGRRRTARSSREPPTAAGRRTALSRMSTSFRDPGAARPARTAERALGGAGLRPVARRFRGAPAAGPQGQPSGSARPRPRSRPRQRRPPPPRCAASALQARASSDPPRRLAPGHSRDQRASARAGC